MATHMSLYGTAGVHNRLWFTVRQRLTVTLSPRDGYRTPYYDSILQGRKWHCRTNEQRSEPPHTEHTVRRWQRTTLVPGAVRNRTSTQQNSVKQPLGASPNTLLFGDAFSVDRRLLTQIDQDVADVKPRSIQDFVDTLIARQTQIIDAAIHSQTAIYEANLRKGMLTTYEPQNFGKG